MRHGIINQELKKYHIDFKFLAASSTLISLILLSVLTSTSFAADDDKIVIFFTNSGPLIIEFFPEDAPGTVENFLKLTESGFYENIVFHRVIEDFMIQGGDPLTKHARIGVEPPSDWGTGDPGYSIPAEFSTIKHNRGIVSMARSADPDSAGSQFFIVHKDANFLDEQYTVFGRLVTHPSYDTLDAIANMETSSKDVPIEFDDTKIFKSSIITRAELDDQCKCFSFVGEPDRVGDSREAEKNLTETSDRFVSKEYDFSFIPPKGWQPVFPLPDSSPDDPKITFIGPGKHTGQFTKIGGTDLASPYIYINVNKLADHSFHEHVESRAAQYHKMNELETLLIQSEKLTDYTTTNGKKYAAYILFAQQEVSKGYYLPFAQAIVSHSDFVYGITYANHELFFDDGLENFYNVMDSFEQVSKPGSPEEVKPPITEHVPTVEELEEQRIKAAEEITAEQEGGGCLIATAAFGSEMAPQIQLLREIRDNTVLQTESGNTFMTGFNQFYYLFSPIVADYERENPVFKETVKLVLTPLLTTLVLLQYTDINSESEMLGYGIGIILLNIGMYFVAPAVVIMKVRSFHKLQ